MATYNDVKELFYELVGDSASSPYIFSDSDISRFAHEALRDMAQRSGFFEGRSVIDLVADQAEYSFSAPGTEKIFRVTYDLKRINPITKRRLRRYDARWREKSGRPVVYYLDELNDQIGFYKKPDSGSVTTYRSTSSATGWITDDDGATRPASGGGMLIDIAGVSPLVDGGGDPLLVDTNYVEIFATYQAANMSGTYQIIMPGWAWNGVLYGAVSRAFEADTKMHNMTTAGYYNMLYEHVVDRLQIRTNGKLPRTWVMEGFGPTKRGFGAVTRLPQHIEES